MKSSVGVCRNFSRGGQRRHFAYTFEVAEVTMQMDFHKTLLPFCTKENAPCYGNSHKNALLWQQ